MPGTSDVIYLYDGSFEGLLCCVHESVYTHELPVDIQPEEAAQPTLFRQKYIAADEEKAARVYDSIPRKISPDAAALVQCVFLSCIPGKELAILRFLLLGYRRGRQTMYLLSHTAVQPMLAARQNLLNEAHLLKEFLRIISLNTLELPPATAEELRYRVLWKRFYKTIAIAARENPRCRMTHCPKRYWENMLEMEDELRRTPDSLDALPAAAPALLPQKEGHYGAQYSFPRLP